MIPHNLAKYQPCVDSMINQVVVFANVGDPGASTVLVDTGALAAGFYDIIFSMNTYIALASTTIVFEWRDATNASSIWNLIYNSPATKCDVFNLRNLKVQASQRFRWYCYGALTGVFGAGIIATRRAI